MKRSDDRILTTHTGSLPRPADLIPMLEALDAGTGPDPAAFAPRVRRDLAARDVEWRELDGRFRGWVVVKRGGQAGGRAGGQPAGRG